jgi:hypothetical protein
MSTIESTRLRLGAALPLRRLALTVPRAQVTRRGLQIALGLIWLLDGGLQFQPFMLRTSFARDVIAPLGVGQPHFVAGPIHWAVNLIAAHPVAWDVPFATVQVLIGLAALDRRSRGIAVAAGFVLALAIWVVAQDIGQLYTGQATDPNSGLIIAVFAIAVLGVRDARVDARVGARGMCAQPVNGSARAANHRSTRDGKSSRRSSV